MNNSLQSNQAILPVKKQELVAFLYDTFNTQPGAAIKLTRTHFTGRFITGLRKYARVPKKQSIPKGWIPVMVEFPKSDFIEAARHFNYFPLEHVTQINDYLQSAFDLFFHVYFKDINDEDLKSIIGGNSGKIELTKMLLVDSFIFGLNLVDLGSADEMIKKRKYREEVEILNKKRKSFLQKELRYRLEIYEIRKKNLKGVVFQ